MQDLQNRQKDLEELLGRKVQELQNVDNVRNQLITEITKMQGKLDILKELIAEEEKASQK